MAANLDRQRDPGRGFEKKPEGAGQETGAAGRTCRLPCEYQFRGGRRGEESAGCAHYWQTRAGFGFQLHHRHHSRRLRTVTAAERRRAHGLRPDEVDGEEQLHSHQRLPGQYRAGPSQPVALPRRRTLSLHLRGWPGALLLAAARLSWHPAGEVHRRRYSPRISVGEGLRPQLHRLLRPSGVRIRLVACPAVRRTGRRGFRCQPSDSDPVNRRPRPETPRIACVQPSSSLYIVANPVAHTMDKRQFLKTSGVLLTGSLFSRLLTGQQPSARTNWAGNYQYSTDRLLLPKSVEEVQQAVKSGKKMRALGARHSFNGIADSKDTQISLKLLDQMTLDAKARTVTVGAGVTYGRLAPYIDSQGFAVHNLASLPHVSVAGACATATHGSGSKNGNLSTAVAGMEMVTADGEVVNLSRQKDGERFAGMVVAFGGLGIVTKVTLDVEPTFQVRQVVYENLS